MHESCTVNHHVTPRSEMYPVQSSLTFLFLLPPSDWIDRLPKSFCATPDFASSKSVNSFLHTAVLWASSNPSSVLTKLKRTSGPKGRCTLHPVHQMQLSTKMASSIFPISRTLLTYQLGASDPFEGAQTHHCDVSAIHCILSSNFK